MMSVVDLLNDFDKPETVRETVKKSNASHDWVGTVSSEAQERRLQDGIQSQGNMQTYPADKAHKEEEPLLSIQHHQQPDWVRRFVHRRLKSWNSRPDVFRNAHLDWCLGLAQKRSIVARRNGNVPFGIVILGHDRLRRCLLLVIRDL